MAKTQEGTGAACAHEHSGSCCAAETHTQNEHIHEEAHSHSEACADHSHQAADSCGCGHDHKGEDGAAHSHQAADGCGCGHDHGSQTKGSDVIRIALGGVCFVVGILTAGPLSVVALVLSYLILGYDVLWRAVKNLVAGKMLDENFLMSVATVGAMLIGEYSEGVAVMLFYQVGEAFQSLAVRRSRRSIEELMDIRPDFAVVLRESVETRVEPGSVQIGEQIVVRPGERVPLDGTILSGESQLDTAALTGESLPRTVGVGEEALSGCVNLSGILTIQVERPFAQSTVSKILNLVENAASKKAETEAFISRFAKVYTPLVVAGAALLAILPPLFGLGSFSQWIYRALTFLVISCPCALVISIPLGFFGGIGAASRCGVLVKGGNYLEALSRLEIVVFDKTGTLTEGKFQVSEIVPVEGITAEQLLESAALLEAGSNHPIARSIVERFGSQPNQARVRDLQERAGHGIGATLDGKRALAGSARLLEGENISLTLTPPEGTVVHVAVEGRYLGYLLIHDRPKADAAAAIVALRESGVRQTVMLTGDSEAAAKQVAGKLGLDRYFARLLPGDKVERVEALQKEKSKKGTLAFVGDGINDAPVLARADIGIAMGGLGSDAAIEAADVVLMTDELSRIPVAVKIARRTLKIIRQNIVLALGIKALVLVLAAFGFSTMWEAVFADVGVSVLAILNSLRVLNVKDIQQL